MIDIQRQLKKLFVVEQKVLQTTEYVFFKKIQIIDAFFIFITLLIEEKFRRQMTIIHVLIVLCKKQKNQDFRHRKINIEKKQISVFLFINLSKTFLMKCEII